MTAPVDRTRPPTPPPADGDAPKRTASGVIPLHWAMPAEVSAKTAGPPPRRPVPPKTGSRAPIFVVGAVLVAGAIALGVLFGAGEGSRFALSSAAVVGATPASSAPASSVATDVSPPPVVAAPAPAPAVVDAAASSAAVASAPATVSPAAPFASAPAVADATSTIASTSATEVVVASTAPVPAHAEPPATATVVAPAATDVAAAPADTPVVDESYVEPVILDELPVRKKAKKLTTRAEGLIKKGQIDGALPLLKQAVRLDPTFAIAHRALGIAHARAGDVTRARRAYERYLELAPDAADAADVRRILGQ